MVASPPYGGVRTGAVAATIGCTLHILHLLYTCLIHASMTGWTRSPAHTASDHATHPQVRVSCSLGALLAQLTIARRSSSGAGGDRPAAARHPGATGTSV